MDIKVLGSGCKKCKTLMGNVEAVIKELGLDANIEKVEDFQKIMEFGVMSTPALVIDGEVKFTGKVLSQSELKKYF